MRLLAFDTSTPHASLSLSDGAEILAETLYLSGSSHSQILPQEIDHLLLRVGWRWADVQGIAVGIGPGSFTGLRVGIASAQGLAWAHGCALYGISSLDALALHAPAPCASIVACLDARKGQIFARIYLPARSPLPFHAVTPPLLLDPAELLSLFPLLPPPVAFLGSGALLLRKELAASASLPPTVLLPPLPRLHLPHASSLAYLALSDPDAKPQTEAWKVQPLYMRPSDAEMRFGPPEGGLALEKRLQPDGSISNTETKGTSIVHFQEVLRESLAAVEAKRSKEGG